MVKNIQDSNYTGELIILLVGITILFVNINF